MLLLKFQIRETKVLSCAFIWMINLLLLYLGIWNLLYILRKYDWPEMSFYCFIFKINCSEGKEVLFEGGTVVCQCFSSVIRRNDAHPVPKTITFVDDSKLDCILTTIIMVRNCVGRVYAIFIIPSVCQYKVWKRFSNWPCYERN